MNTGGAAQKNWAAGGMALLLVALVVGCGPGERDCPEVVDQDQHAFRDGVFLHVVAGGYLPVLEFEGVATFADGEVQFQCGPDLSKGEHAFQCRDDGVVWLFRSDAQFELSLASSDDSLSCTDTITPDYQRVDRFPDYPHEAWPGCDGLYSRIAHELVELSGAHPEKEHPLTTPTRAPLPNLSRSERPEL